VLDILKSGLVPEARADEASRRLLREQFLLGLFENPYVDPSEAGAIVGKDAFRAKALDAQRKSIVLLQNLQAGPEATLPWEAGNLSFTSMAASKSWAVSPVADVKTVREVGPARTILCIYFRQPYVLDEESGLKKAGAILAGFGVSDAALMDVITGAHNPTGKLPFALARTQQAIVANAPDAPGYPAADTLFPFGFGLRCGTAARTERR
jgi:hypothetical protein